jgi:hypothetical protein
MGLPPILIAPILPALPEAGSEAAKGKGKLKPAKVKGKLKPIPQPKA